MSKKSRFFSVAAATVTLTGLWVPAALAGTTQGPAGGYGGLVNGGLVNLNFGSGNTAIGNTCKNTNENGALEGNILSWALNLNRTDCMMAGGPGHF